ncbi:multidrug efflux RND transporter permease [Vibrio sp. 10N.286.49.C2]|uniref:efflux RND transporter permease subunit n=1 Tax=unclassified Vibrio TaxID=2614977 RepID=UPI000C83769B|nr:MULTISPECIES: efflux RND transporter permease subunit [unclassified Vibrio]PMH33847.1 multidrug efflux RND transporter permease [Vibrio sp. 10N.286.49.C2]PMH44105.1 multidrug efflux RND transporter permease [Vibrio sp. 10N.286.49.B1]PMH80946.1 multidrug efflux RND transporter permease [Vibrio sp. 10N.286.48.B7]
MSRFFINRPIFAWVIAIIIMLSGIASILSLPVAQYPTIAPPSIKISTSYPGASAKAIEDSVTQVIEQSMTGLDNLLYMSSISDSSGNASITLTFSADTDPDIAQVQVQNNLQQATNRLPTAVQNQGTSVTKSSSGFMSVTNLYSPDGTMSSADIQDYANSSIKDILSRVNGVGEVTIFGPSYAMRIWLDPAKLNSYTLTPSDISAAVSEQNSQVTVGQLGGTPATDSQLINASITAQSLLTTTEEFENILIKVEDNGSQIRLKDVARVELGSEDFSVVPAFNGYGSSGIAITLASGANSLDTQAAVDAKLAQMSESFPDGLLMAKATDNNAFIRLSITEVVKTLFEAVVLVFFVMLLFLQNLRATLIPTIAVPVVLLGTFSVMAVLGFSINTLTMFGMVLAIGLLVDDAIVVVENVERIMHEEKLSPLEATKKSMNQITGALIGITMVLAVVFIPMAFMSGSSGAIYQQFSLTIVSAMVLSVLVALILTPVLCATLLKPAGHTSNSAFFNAFNRFFDRSLFRYRASIKHVLNRPLRFVFIYIVLLGGGAYIYNSLPSAFLPNEDQGEFMVMASLPNGSTLRETTEVMNDVTAYFQQHEPDTVNTVFTTSGFNFSGKGQNAAMGFIGLKDWSERTAEGTDVNAIIARTMAYFSTYKKASIFAFSSPAIRELGTSSGFDFYLEDVGNLGHDELINLRNQLLEKMAQSPILQKVRPNGLEDNAQFFLDIDYEKAKVLGLEINDINETLSIAWGSSYVNDFIDRGRSKKVYLQADAEYRMTPEDLELWYVRNSNDEMVPLSAFSSSHWGKGSPQLMRYNGNSAVEIIGEAGAGYSTGDAMDEVNRLAAELSNNIQVSWTGMSYQELESGGQAPILYAVSLLMVFLCLAALYESWSIPVAIILVVPLGILGALAATTLRGMENDVYFQVGLLTTIGLSAKNAILIVEFAKELYEKGMSLVDATVKACEMRLRPIIMTSLAFVLGVLPLVISTGAGANARNALGTSVMGGMIAATILVVYFAPLFFVLIVKMFGGNKDTMNTASTRKSEADTDTDTA